MSSDLRVPNGIGDDPNAQEILRVWTSDDSQKFVLRPDVWDDPAAWGLLLVDIARQAAQGISEVHGGDPEAIMARIKAGFDAEWWGPTDD